MKLSTKLIMATTVLIVIMGLLTIGAISTIVEQAMTEQLEEQGLNIALMAADNVANPLLDENILIVQRMIENLKDTGSGISYVYIIDNEGKVAAHTFSGGFPINLININVLKQNNKTQTVLLNTESEGLLRDVGVRVLDGLNAEIHIGFSQNSILEFLSNIKSLLVNMTLYGIFLGSIAALILSNLITKPLKTLAAYSLRLGKGDFEQDIVIKGKDEIAELALCLNRMRKEIFTGMKKLRQSEESNRNLLEAISAAGEGIVVFHGMEDNKHQIKYVNERYEYLTGYSKRELLETEADSVVYSESKDRLQEVWDRYQQGTELPKQLEIPLKRKDNTKFYVEASYCKIMYEGSQAIICIIRDITEKKKFSMELIRRNRELAVLNKIASASTGPINLKDNLEAILAIILQVFGKKIGWIFIYEEREAEPDVKLMCHTGIPLEEALEQIRQIQTYNRTLKTKINIVQLQSPMFKDSTINQLELLEGTTPLFQVFVPLIYKGRVLGGLNIIGSGLGSLSKEDSQLLNSIGVQLGVALENAKLWEELNKKEILRKQLLNKVITAQEEERQRISRELHDETSQSIAALSVGLKSAIEIMKQDKNLALTILEELKNNTSMILRELHHIIYDLRPSLLDDLGLLPALNWYIETRLEKTGIIPHVTITGNPVQLAEEIEITIFRIVQESIFNAVKYSMASDINLGLEFGFNELIVYVEDNGIGFNVHEALNQKDGKESLGLLGIKERAELIGGVLDIRSEENNGTRIQLKLTIPDERGESYDQD